MEIFKVSWIEKVRYSADVEAENSSEAIEKLKNGEVIAGSQDTHMTESKKTKIEANLK